MTGSITKTTGENSLECRKLHKTVNEGSVHCSDPKLYCKFRSSCIIWFMAKEECKQPHPGEESP